MRSKIIKLAFALGIISFVLTQTRIALAANLCIPSGYTIGFFNGVFNTAFDASRALAELRRLKGTSNNGEAIQYELFYNYTGPVRGNSSALEDLGETFEQRFAALENSGDLAKRWEFFWEILNNEDDRAFQKRLINISSSLGSVFNQLISEFSAFIPAALSKLINSPPTEANYATHNTRLNALAVQQQKLVLVAHSQGNLFVNHAYDFISPKIGMGSVRTVHIAPASPTLRGAYLLADIDVVINGLRLVGGPTTVPPNNISLPTSALDLSGHTLLGTYLDANRAARLQINLLIGDALSKLITPPTMGNVGAFTVTLTWDGPGDIDLHLFEPNGKHVYYLSRVGTVGILDVDNRLAEGPEHYFAACDSRVIQNGNYSVGLNNFRGGEGRIATVQLSSSMQGILLTKKFTIGAERGVNGDISPTPVMDIQVMKKPITEELQITAR